MVLKGKPSQKPERCQGLPIFNDVAEHVCATWFEGTLFRLWFFNPGAIEAARVRKFFLGARAARTARRLREELVPSGLTGSEKGHDGGAKWTRHVSHTSHGQRVIESLTGPWPVELTFRDWRHFRRAAMQHNRSSCKLIHRDI